MKSGMKIVTKRLFNPLYLVDFIWNQTNASKRLHDYNQFGREMFMNVKIT